MLRLVVVTLLLTLTACGSPEPVTPNPTPEPPVLATCPSTIVIDEFAYEPGNCQVTAGTTLTFLNQDTVPHTATSRPGALDSFDTGTISVNESATVTFSTRGDYDYFCTIHPDMAGSITVK